MPFCKNPCGTIHKKKYFSKTDLRNVGEILSQECRIYLPNLNLNTEDKLCVVCRRLLQDKLAKKIAEGHVERNPSSLITALPQHETPSPDTALPQHETPSPDAVLPQDGTPSPDADLPQHETPPGRPLSQRILESEAVNRVRKLFMRDSGDRQGFSSESSANDLLQSQRDSDGLEHPNLVNIDELELRSIDGSSVAAEDENSLTGQSEKTDDSSPETIKSVNQQLKSLKQSPFTSRVLRSKTAVGKKIEKAVIMFKGSLQKVTGSPTVSVKCDDCTAFTSALFARYMVAGTKEERYRILSCTPVSWSIRTIMKKMNCSKYEATIAAKLKTEIGPYSVPVSELKRGGLPEETVNLIKAFYLSTDNSRICPGQRETLMVRNEDGIRARVAKQRLLVSLRELHADFRKKYEDNPVSISKFSLLRPGQCVWPGSKGRHNTCTCEKHENFKLLLEGAKNKISTTNFLKSVLCTEAIPDCYLGYCEKCPDIEEMKKHTTEIEDDENIDFYQWVNTDRSEIVKLTEPVADFIQRLHGYVHIISRHHFIAKEQQGYINMLVNEKVKEESSLVVQVDFGQNYSFVVQNSVQGFHWNNVQATIHPFVVHWYNSNKEKRYKTYFVISDDLKHDSNRFHFFRIKMLEKVKEEFGETISKIYYVSDGPSSQYKNQYNIYNLSRHVADFQLKAEWIFTATSHGKSMCDGLSGVVKRAARLYSMREGVFLTTPKQMFDYCQRDLTTDKLHFIFVSHSEVEEYWSQNANRYENSKAIPGIRKIHYVRPITENELQLKEYSNSPIYKTFKYTRDELRQPTLNVYPGAYVAAVVNRSFQIGLVIQEDDSKKEFTMKMMKKLSTQNNFSWPDVDIQELLTVDDILMSIDAPTTASGRLYNLTKTDFTRLKELFAAYQKKEKNMILRR